MWLIQGPPYAALVTPPDVEKQMVVLYVQMHPILAMAVAIVPQIWNVVGAERHVGFEFCPRYPIILL
jgi:hypothetical protein